LKALGGSPIIKLGCCGLEPSAQGWPQEIVTLQQILTLKSSLLPSLYGYRLMIGWRKPVKGGHARSPNFPCKLRYSGNGLVFTFWFEEDL